MRWQELWRTGSVPSASLFSRILLHFHVPIDFAGAVSSPIAPPAKVRLRSFQADFKPLSLHSWGLVFTLISTSSNVTASQSLHHGYEMHTFLIPSESCLVVNCACCCSLRMRSVTKMWVHVAVIKITTRDLFPVSSQLWFGADVRSDERESDGKREKPGERLLTAMLADSAFVSTYPCPVCRKAHPLDLDRLQVIPWPSCISQWVQDQPFSAKLFPNAVVTRIAYLRFTNAILAVTNCECKGGSASQGMTLMQ